MCVLPRRESALRTALLLFGVVLSHVHTYVHTHVRTYIVVFVLFCTRSQYMGLCVCVLFERQALAAGTYVVKAEDVCLVYCRFVCGMLL